MGTGAVRSFARIARARHRGTLVRVFVALWLGLLLFLIGYVAINGAAALSDLDDVRLIAAAYELYGDMPRDGRRMIARTLRAGRPPCQ
jgi:ABC-type spermidine/putrescine transport system permease subunit II